MMFARLKDLRDKLASIPAFGCDAETRKALVEAIDELEAAMVQETRTNHYLRTLPPPPLDIAEFAKDMVLSMNRMAVIDS